MKRGVCDLVNPVCDLLVLIVTASCCCSGGRRALPKLL